MSGPPCRHATREEPYTSRHNSRQMTKFFPARLRRPFYAAVFPKKAHVSFGTQKGPRHSLRNSRSSRDTCPNSRGTLSFPPQVKKSPVFPASTRDEALFFCTDPSAVPRVPSNSTIFLTSHKHPEKLPEVTVTCRGKPEFPAATTERTRYSPFKAS